MIKLTYNGHACFTLDFDGYTIVVDPFTGVPGYGELNLTANGVLCSHSHEDHNNVAAVKILGGPKPSDLEITEIKSFHDQEFGKLRGTNTLRIFEYKGLRVMHCGDIGVMPTKPELSLMKNLDCVLIPVGGFYTLEPAECKEFLDLINPKLVIPMHFRTETFGYDNIGTVDAFTSLYSNVKVSNESSVVINGEDKGILILQVK